MDFDGVQGWWVGTDGVTLHLHGLVGKWLQENKRLDAQLNSESEWELRELCFPLCDREGSRSWQSSGILE